MFPMSLHFHKRFSNFKLTGAKDWIELFPSFDVCSLTLHILIFFPITTWLKLDHIWVWYSLDGPLPKLCPMTLPYIQDGCYAMASNWLKNWQYSSEPLDGIKPNLVQIPLSKFCQSVDPINYTRCSPQLIMQLLAFQHWFNFLTSNLTNILKSHFN